MRWLHHRKPLYGMNARVTNTHADAQTVRTRARTHTHTHKHEQNTHVQHLSSHLDSSTRRCAHFPARTRSLCCRIPTCIPPSLGRSPRSRPYVVVSLSILKKSSIVKNVPSKLKLHDNQTVRNAWNIGLAAVRPR